MPTLTIHLSNRHMAMLRNVVGLQPYGETTPEREAARLLVPALEDANRTYEEVQRIAGLLGSSTPGNPILR